MGFLNKRLARYADDKMRLQDEKNAGAAANSGVPYTRMPPRPLTNQPAAIAAGAPQSDWSPQMDALHRLVEQRNAGQITQEQFVERKARIFR